MTKLYLHVGLPKTATTAMQLIVNATGFREIGGITFDEVDFTHRLPIETIPYPADP